MSRRAKKQLSTNQKNHVTIRKNLKKTIHLCIPKVLRKYTYTQKVKQ